MRDFCTDRAIACGEPLAGTGAIARRHLFLRWPKTKWRRPRLAAEGLSDPLRAAMKMATGGERYVGLIAGDGEELELTSFPECTRTIARDQNELVALVEAWGRGEPLTGTPIGRGAILCCTDAKTDACCARYGFPLYKALLAQAPAMGFEVLQCTHIGGCHFAPSVVVMPQRQRYGRLTPQQVPDFLAALDRGEIYLPNFKGDAALDELGQAADIAVRLWAADLAPAPITIAHVERQGEDRATLTMHFGPRAVTVRATREIFPVYGACRDLDGPPTMKPRWTAEVDAASVPG